MDFKQKLEKLVELVTEINRLNLFKLCSIRIYGCGDHKRLEVQMYGGAKALPEGEVKYRIFDKERVCSHPWEAYVEINGVEYNSLVSYDEAWALYV